MLNIELDGQIRSVLEAGEDKVGYVLDLGWCGNADKPWVYTAPRDKASQPRSACISRRWSLPLSSRRDILPERLKLDSLDNVQNKLSKVTKDFVLVIWGSLRRCDLVKDPWSSTKSTIRCSWSQYLLETMSLAPVLHRH